MAGKKIPINLDLVEQLSSNGATYEQIALSLGISVDTLARRRKDSAEVADAIKKGKAKGSVFVMSKLMELINEKNLGAIIFYLKTQCDWKETSVIDNVSSDGSMTPKSWTPKDVANELIAQMQEMDNDE